MGGDLTQVLRRPVEPAGGKADITRCAQVRTSAHKDLTASFGERCKGKTVTGARCPHCCSQLLTTKVSNNKGDTVKRFHLTRAVTVVPFHHHILQAGSCRSQGSHAYTLPPRNPPTVSPAQPKGARGLCVRVYGNGSKAFIFVTGRAVSMR
jgi:hypothetical protein